MISFDGTKFWAQRCITRIGHMYNDVYVTISRHEIPDIINVMTLILGLTIFWLGFAAFGLYIMSEWLSGCPQ